MDFLEVFKGRRSIRKFKPDPVPRSVLEEILSEARWCPSWANTQPWEVMVASGQPLERFKAGQREKVSVRAPHRPDIPTPDKFPPKWHERVADIGKCCLDAQGIGREDRDARNRYYEEMFTLFDAPVLMLLLLDDQLDIPYGMMDLGIFLHGVCLVAQSKGVGTLVLSTVVRYPDLLRSVLSVPANKRTAMGIAMGYPDESARINQFERRRVPVSEFAAWVE